ncbi:MAG: serine hydrolase domain-containing protein [Patescibacteria group bacterium]
MENNFLAPYRDGITPGCAIGIIKEGKIVHAALAGYSDLDKYTLISIDTNFRLASVSKHFTAVAILVLVQKGLLSLDAKLRDFFPEFPIHAKDVTIQHLHTASSHSHIRAGGV